MARSSLARVTDRYLWVLFAALAGVGFLVIWEFLPHERAGLSLWQFLLKISVFILAVVAVSALPSRSRLRYLLVSVPVLVLLGFIVPRMTHLFFLGSNVFPQYYTYLWSVQYPCIILALCLAYRMGGGSIGNGIKIGLSGVIILISGYLDLMYFVVNPGNYYDTPTIPHVQIILGHMPTYFGLIIFALCHVPILVAVNLLPIDRWITRLRRAAPAPDAA